MASVIPAFLPVVYDSMPKAEFLNFFRDIVCQADVELFKKLKMNLVVAVALLDDADIKQTRNPSVKQWLEELRDTVYKADGLLSEISTEALRVKEENVCQSSSSCICNWESACNYSPSLSSQFLRRIIPEIERIAVRLDAFVRQINPWGLQVGESRRQSHRLPTTSLVDETAIYGRENDREKIIQMLLSEAANGDGIAVIPIFGLGGIGKTTLAQLVYNDDRVKNHFSTKAWVYVSEEYDPTRMTKELLRELNISFSDSHENLNSLQVKLKVALTGKKFLLVLDDVWISDYNQWGNLRIAFKGGLQGSRIILTTRNLYVARMMGREESIHHMNLISEDDCWSLFVKHAFENRAGNQALEFEAIGKKIVKKCGGLPLAVKTVAGLLRSKTTTEEWEDIFMSEDWTLANNQMIPPLSNNHLLSYPNRYQLRSTGMTQELQEVHRQLDMTFWHYSNSLQKLCVAASGGDVGAIYRVINNNPNLLEGISEKPFNHTPLHIAAETGHTHFALEIMSLKPSLGRVLNHDGFSPLDLALRNGHKKTVRRLVRFAPELIRIQGRERITPLHYVAQAEEIDLLAEFLLKCPASIEDVTLCCETALHISAKNGRLRAFKVLFGWLQRTDRKEILNWEDEDGNTVLHIAASTNQTEVAKLLVRHVNLNAKNHEGLTALDIANTRLPIQVNTRMKKILHGAGASKASRLRQLPTLAEMLGSPEALIEKIFHVNAYLDEGLSGEMRNSMLVAAILIATSAYQSVLSPPGGVHQGDTNTFTNSMATLNKPTVEPGEVVMRATKFYPFLVGNSLAFGASLGIVFLLLPTTGYGVLHISLVLLMLGYIYSALTISPATPAAVCFVFAGFLLFTLIVAVRMVWKLLQRFPSASWETIGSVYFPNRD